MTLLILIGSALAASFISGVAGMGGGVLLLAIMASILEPELVVPIHGAVQLVSNSTRSLRLAKSVTWWVFRLYVPALLVGVVIGLRFYSGEGMPWFRPAIGAFVLCFLLWDLIKPEKLNMPRLLFVPAGLVGGLLTIIVGASGPFLAAFFLRDDMEKEEIVATKATIQMIGHFSKIVAFSVIGFAWASHAKLVLPLMACAVLGTLAGTWALKRVDDRVFAVIFRVVLTLLGLRLIAFGVWR